MEFIPLPKTHPALNNAVGPEAMAIGDSIFNGVRSLTINEDLAHGAPPAQLARAFDWPMRVPDYRREVLFQLEDEIREGIDLDRIRKHVIDNAQRWLDERGNSSPHMFFDNISIGGAAYAHLDGLTAGDARAQIVPMLVRLRNAPSLDFAALGELWFNLNAAFVLNPSGHPDLEDLTALEQVASRKPKRLFVNIGSNEGLFRIGITANPSRKNRESIGQIPRLAEELARKLKKHCDAVQRIYFNDLIRPRALANLAPRRDEEMFRHPKDGYFDEYIGRLGSLNRMSGEQMKAFDEEIAKVNKDVRKTMSGILKDKIVFVDTYAMAGRIDGKHHGKERMVTVHAGPTPKRMSNMPLSANLFGFRQGGLFGLDNMHPTRVGYALLAQEMAAVVARAEAVAMPEIEPQLAFEADGLLQDPPRNLDRLGLFTGFIAAVFFGGSV